MQVVHVDRVLHDVVAEVVGRAVARTRPSRRRRRATSVKQRGVVVAAVVVGRQLALAVDGPAELAAPDDQRVVEQPALLQVLHQRRASAWSVSSALEPDRRSAGRRAGPSRGGRAGRTARPARPAAAPAGSSRRRCPACGRRDRTARTTSSGSLRQVEQLGHRGLHPERQLVLLDPRPDLRVADRVALEPVERRARRRACCRRSPRRRPAGFERNSTGSPSDRNCTPWCVRRQEAAAPQAEPKSGWAGRRAPVRRSTTKAGRSGSRCPRP